MHRGKSQSQKCSIIFYLTCSKVKTREDHINGCQGRKTVVGACGGCRHKEVRSTSSCVVTEQFYILTVVVVVTRWHKTAYNYTHIRTNEYRFF